MLKDFGEYFLSYMQNSDVLGSQASLSTTKYYSLVHCWLNQMNKNKGFMIEQNFFHFILYRL